MTSPNQAPKGLLRILSNEESVDIDAFIQTLCNDIQTSDQASLNEGNSIGLEEIEPVSIQEINNSNANMAAGGAIAPPDKLITATQALSLQLKPCYNSSPGGVMELPAEQESSPQTAQNNDKNNYPFKSFERARGVTSVNMYDMERGGGSRRGITGLEHIEDHRLDESAAEDYLLALPVLFNNPVPEMVNCFNKTDLQFGHASLADDNMNTWTCDDEKLTKEKTKREKNKIAARKSREKKKKNKQQQLKINNEFRKENERLKRDVKELEETLNTLLEYLQEENQVQKLSAYLQSSHDHDYQREVEEVCMDWDILNEIFTPQSTDDPDSSALSNVTPTNTTQCPWTVEDNADNDSDEENVFKFLTKKHD